MTAFGGVVSESFDLRRSRASRRHARGRERIARRHADFCVEALRSCGPCPSPEACRRPSRASGSTAAPRARAEPCTSKTRSDDIPSVTTDYRSGKRAPVEHTVSGEAAAAFTPAIAGQTSVPPRPHRPRAAAGSKYNGRRIDLDLKDADIHNVLRLLADVGQVNIVTADDVPGTITIRMRNVPWDQALDVVLQAKGLGMVRHGNLDPRRAARRSSRKSASSPSPRRSRSSSSRRSRRASSRSATRRPRSSRRARRISSRRAARSPSTSAPTCSSRATSPGNLNQIEELVRSLDTQTPQVLVEARIVEATSRYLRDVGIQWGGDATFSAATGNPTGLAFPLASASPAVPPTRTRRPRASRRSRATVANPNFAVNLPAAVGTGQRRRARPHVRLDRQQLQPGAPPLGGRVERHAPHRCRARASSRSTTARRASARAR